MNKNLMWLVIALGTILIGAAVAVAAKEYLFPTNGSIAVIGLSVTWLDGGLPVEDFEWGTIENTTAYLMELINITNIENTNVTLTLGTKDLSLSIITLSLTWNYTDTILEPDDWILVELEQTVTATGDFSYTTVITATEA